MSTMTDQAIFNMTPPTAVPCPAWCESPNGHPYELEEHDGAESRHHHRTFGAGALLVDVAALGVYREGREEVGPLSVEVWIDGNGAGPELSAGRARELAALLVAAAEWLAANQ